MEPVAAATTPSRTGGRNSGMPRLIVPCSGAANVITPTGELPVFCAHAAPLNDAKTKHERKAREARKETPSTRMED